MTVSSKSGLTWEFNTYNGSMFFEFFNGIKVEVRDEPDFTWECDEDPRWEVVATFQGKVITTDWKKEVVFWHDVLFALNFLEALSFEDISLMEKL